MATHRFTLAKKLLLLAAAMAAVIAAVAAYEVHAWKRERARFAAEASAPAVPGQLSFSLHYPEGTTAQVGETIRVLHELRMQNRKLRTAEVFTTRSGWGSRQRKLSLPGWRFDRGTGYARFGLSIQGRAADECYPILREVMVAYLGKQPDLTGATLRILDERGVRTEYVCRDAQPAAWPPEELPAAARAP